MRPYECASTDDVFFLHSFPVTACSNSQIALKTLRAKKEDFDIVLSDVHMPDMDGFKLLELIQFELDLPVLMMSANSDSSVVLRELFTEQWIIYSSQCASKSCETFGNTLCVASALQRTRMTRRRRRVNAQKHRRL